MDRMQATPRNAFVGGLADFLAAGTSPQRTQQMRGLMEFLQVPDIAKTLDRVSYGEPLTTGRGMTTKLRPEAEASLMTALGMAPVGRPVEAGAMALGRAGERVAERVVPRVMERGGLPAEMLGAMAQGTQSPATVFHGSPHRFTKFDSSKIGTGEGNQTYGYGLYFAENPAVAKDYQNTLSKNQLEYSIKGKRFDEIPWLKNSGIEEGWLNNWVLDNIARGRATTGDSVNASAIDYVDDLLERSRNKNDLKQQKALEKLKGLIQSGDISAKYTKGNLYQVDLPDEQIAKMLDYDKPLSQQPPAVQAALRNVKNKELRAVIDYASTPYSTPGLEGEAKTMGEAIKLLGMNTSPAKGSAMLAKAGIPGIRYLDQGSRGAGQGTSNFVVLPGMEDMLRIEKINEQPINSLLQTIGR